MIGKKFKSLTIISLDEEKNKQLKSERKQGLRKNAPVYYICKCDWGNERSLPKQKILNRKEYGCKECKNIDFQQYIGSKINSWTIISYIKYDKPFFKCKCECGNVVEVNAYNVLSGKSKNCGCVRKEKLYTQRKDLIGMKFGKLLVLEKIKTNKHNKDIYRCKCDCGNETEVWSSSLTTGHTTSCGCIRSKYENLINEIVSKLGYDGKKEYQVNLKNNKIDYFRFDVYIPSIKLAIEYDGEFHFKPIPFINIENSIIELEKTQERDMIKEKYCYENNIFLLRIPYTQKENIENIIIETINLITCND